MSKSILATLLALPGIILTWYVYSLVEDAQQQAAVATVSVFNPSYGALLQLVFAAGAVVAIVTFVLALLAKFGIKY